MSSPMVNRPQALAPAGSRWYYRAVSTTSYASLARYLVPALALALSLLSAAPALSQWSDVERWLNGSQPISLGVDTSRFRIAVLGARSVIAGDEPTPDSAPYRLID